MKILLASDHAGFELKNEILKYLESEAFSVEDLGAYSLNKEDDYPEIILPLAMRIVEDSENTRGIVFGKSGNGEAIISNRLPGVRAIVYYGKNLEIVKLGREHNNANILSLGAGFVGAEEAIQAVNTFIKTSFSNDERHIRRNEMLDNIA